jgi:transglutaminase-like putative cysteine protease
VSRAPKKARPGAPEADADRDTFLGRAIRALRHPLRALAMAAATFCLITDVALSSGIVSAIFGALVGTVLGELVGRSRVRLPWALGAIAGSVVIGLLAGALVLRAEWLVSLLGPAGALHASGFFQYGAVVLGATIALRAIAIRHPAWLSIELGVLVVAVAVALAAHRGGVIARPLWLSDFAWRRGLDPENVLIAIGVFVALIAMSLLLFERRGRLSLAALPLIPLIAMLAVSCFEVTREAPEESEASADPEESEGGEPNDTPDGDPRGGGGGGGDGGAPRDGGSRPVDGGSRGGGRADGGVGDGGGSAGGRDGGGGRGEGHDGGGTGGGRADGRRDGGRGSGGIADGGGGGRGGTDGGRGGGDGGSGDGRADGGRGGGGGGGDDRRDGGGSGDSRGDGGRGGGGSARDGGARDAGTGGGARGDGGRDPWDGWDAGLDDSELPESHRTSESQGESSSGPVDPEDLGETPPPTGERSAAPVAVVLFERDYSPPSETYYFRQEVWSQLAGRRLVPSTRADADRDLAERFPTGRLLVDDPPPEAGRAEVGALVALLVTHPRPFSLESPVWFSEAQNPSPGRFRRAYRFFARAQTIDYPELLGRPAGDPRWSPEVRAMYLEQHPDPRFAAFAEETIAGMTDTRRDDPFGRAVAIKLRLDEMLIYSSAERHAGSEDPAVDFFFGNRTGYCVHFAHTAAYLFRAAGVPTRIGVGYMSAEANRRGGSALVIQSGDAHAWPEIYIEGIGWIVLDIAAAQNLDPPRPPQDDELQQLLGEMAREQPPDPEDEIEREPTPPFPIARTLGWTLAATIALLLLALYVIKAWRRLAPAFASPRALPRIGYRAALDRLAEVGLAREHGETREQFARRAAALSPTFERATMLMLAARLREAGPLAGREEHDRAAWRETTRAMRQELGRGTKWWRRALGLAHPLSFLDAR